MLKEIAKLSSDMDFFAGHFTEIWLPHRSGPGEAAARQAEAVRDRPCATPTPLPTAGEAQPGHGQWKKALARLSRGMLLLHGLPMDLKTLRGLDRDEPSPLVKAPRERRRRFRRARRQHNDPSPGRDWRTPLELVVMAAIGGSSFLFLRVASPVFGPAPVIDLRLAIGALILMPFLWRARAQLAAAGWWKIVAIGAVNTLIPFLLFAWSSEHAPAGVNAIVFSMAVPFAALGAFVLYGERMGKRRVVGMLAGLVGVVILAGGDLAGAGLGLSVAAGALAALLYGGSSNLIRRHFADVPATALVAAMLASDALLLAPFAVWTWPSTPIPAQAWLTALALGVFGTGIVYVLYFRLIQRVGAPRAVTMAYLVPVFGVLWAWLALGEPLTIDMAAGGALILGGMLLAQHHATSPTTRRAAVIGSHCIDCDP